MYDYRNILIDFFKSNEVFYNSKTIDKIISFLEEVFQFNLSVNIVGTKSKDEIFIRHIMDSLSIFSLKNYFSYNDLVNKKILDFGSGAGFPGILFAIILEDSKVFLLEKNQKKANFLIGLSKKLELNNTEILNFSAENLAKKPTFREKFDYSVARAVSNIFILLELIIPFAKIGGKIFLYKSKKVFNEILETKELINRLGAEVESVNELKVPLLEEFRVIEVLKKITKTPKKYPRDLSIIKKTIA